MDRNTFTLPASYANTCDLIDSHPDLLEVFLRDTESGRYLVAIDPNETSIGLEIWFDDFKEASIYWMCPETRTTIWTHAHAQWCMDDFKQALDRYTIDADLSEADRNTLDANQHAIITQAARDLCFMHSWQEMAIQLGNEMIDTAIIGTCNDYLNSHH